MNKYWEALKRLEGMVLTSPFKDDVGDGVVDMNDLYKCGTQLQNEYLHDLNVLKELVDKADSFEWIPFEMKDGFILCQIKAEDGFLHRQIPNVGEEILVTDGKRVWEDTWIEYDDGYALDSNYELDEVTAWMPLPEPYKENEND
jgi:hypothetical protein